MCSRFEMNATPHHLAERFQLVAPPVLAPSAVVRPTDQAVAVGPARHGRLLRFGLTVPWDKRPLINARAETLATKPTFRAMLGRRCLIPATAWIEWRKDGAAKRLNRLAPAEGGVFALAALWQDDGFVVVTCAAAPSVAAIHDRMPVVLSPAHEAAWLDATQPPDALAALLVPYSGPLTAVEAATPDAKTPPSSADDTAHP